MKIRRIMILNNFRSKRVKRIQQKHKLLKLKLIKNKIYKNSIHFMRVRHTIYSLKKALCVLYKFHAHNRKIVFIGTPSKQNAKFLSLIKSTKHIAIPESLWVDGLITNPLLYEKEKIRKDKNFFKFLSGFAKTPDLIVIFNKVLNTKVLNEGHIAKIPTICFNDDSTVFDIRPTYGVQGNFEFVKKQAPNNLFYSIIKTILKRSYVQRNSLAPKFKKRVSIPRYANNIKSKNQKQKLKQQPKQHKKQKSNNAKKPTIL